MSFPKSRILNTQQLIQQIIESNRNGERFCFILGSGASVESGIPSGNTLEMRWMDYIMGLDKGPEIITRDADFTRKWANQMYEDKLIEHPFKEIEAEWKNAKTKNKSIPSKYYFDIYKLRFYPNPRNGYRYLEQIMESCEPSLGYHTLALLLTKNNQNNLVITTNFDSLVEDALFLYTNKKPLVVSHESLAGYIESDIQRPIIAKVHRGLLYAPFNSPETTNELKEEWRDALSYVVSTYTPIVIGYGGGDHSLMSFLEEDSTVMRHGIYWCYRDNSGLPDESIQKFIEKKEGYFVTIGGFDALMMEIGKLLYREEITPKGTDETLKNQHDKRSEKYRKQWDKLNKNPEIKEVLKSMVDEEQHEEDEREKNNELTAWDYTRRGDRAYSENRFEEALEAYTKAIELRNDYASDYYNRGTTYDKLNQFDKAIDDYCKAIELNPDFSLAYNNRGYAYNKLKLRDKALADYSKALELDPHDKITYYNRGSVYCDLNQFEEAINDFSNAIRVDPDYEKAYNNRGYAYFELYEYKKAIKDYNKALELNPRNVAVLSNRGDLYCYLEKYEEAIEDYNKALELAPQDEMNLNNRGYAYHNMGEYQKAIEDYSKAIELNPNKAIFYNNRGNSYKKLNQFDKAIENYNSAINIDPEDKKAYLNRAEAYRNIGKNDLAEKDEKFAESL